MRRFLKKADKLDDFYLALLTFSAELKTRGIDRPLRYFFTILPYCWLILVDGLMPAIVGYIFLLVVWALLSRYLL